MAVAIFDGHYLLHRCLHVPQLRNLGTGSRRPTGALFGMIKSIRSTLYTWSEVRRVIVVFDGGHSSRRLAMYPEYKGNREEDNSVDPDGLTYEQKFRMQLNYAQKLLPHLGIKVVRIPGKEGDDVVSLLAHSLPDTLKIVASDDKDMFQLVREDCHLWRPMAEERVTLQNFTTFADGVPRERWMLNKALRGDKSDNIKGVKGTGDKTIDQIFDEYKGPTAFPYTEFFDWCAAHKSKKIAAIGANKEIILRNHNLLDLQLEPFSQEERNHADLSVNTRALVDVVAVKKFFISFEYASLIDNFNVWITRFQTLT